jgi:hypothetical protein
MAAAARQDAYEVVRRRVDDGDAARKPLKPAERGKQIFSVIGDRSACKSGPIP